MRPSKHIFYVGTNDGYTCRAGKPSVGCKEATFPAAKESCARASYGDYRKERRVAIIKKLTRLGNSSAVILDKPVLRLLDLEPDSEVRISVEGDAICIRRHHAARERQVPASRAKSGRTRRRGMPRMPPEAAGAS